MGVKYKYFIHYDSNGEIIGHDMAPDHLTESEFESPSVEVTQEFFLEYFTSFPEVRKKFKIDTKGKKVISK
jgi:hypothetical protein